MATALEVADSKAAEQNRTLTHLITDQRENKPEEEKRRFFGLLRA